MIVRLERSTCLGLPSPGNKGTTMPIPFYHGTYVRMVKGYIKTRKFHDSDSIFYEVKSSRYKNTIEVRKLVFNYMYLFGRRNACREAKFVFQKQNAASSIDGSAPMGSTSHPAWQQNIWCLTWWINFHLRSVKSYESIRCGKSWLCSMLKSRDSIS